jgi:hypothetical protein
MFADKLDTLEAISAHGHDGNYWEHDYVGCDFKIHEALRLRLWPNTFNPYCSTVHVPSNDQSE